MKFSVVVLMATFFLVPFQTPTAQASEMAQTRRMMAGEEPTKVVKDIVKKVREDDEGLVILFEKTPGSFYLSRAVDNFEGLRKILEKSLADKKPVSVTADSSDLNILEVK